MPWCMTYGAADRGNHAWTMDEASRRPLIQRALELGINFLDTANVYSDGHSEEIVGRTVRDFSRRENVVIATKLNGRMRPGPNGAGLSRRAIMTEIDNSLRRLGTDWLDRVRQHAGSPQPAEPRGGAGDAAALRRPGHRRAALESVGPRPADPRLGRDQRATGDNVFGKTLYAGTIEADRQIVQQVAEVAAQRGVPRAQVALAWVAQKSVVTAPIIGASKLRHLEDAVAALSLALTPDEIATLEAPDTSRAVAGFR